jgi:hypothetical protein
MLTRAAVRCLSRPTLQCYPSGTTPMAKLCNHLTDNKSFWPLHSWCSTSHRSLTNISPRGAGVVSIHSTRIRSSKSKKAAKSTSPSYRDILQELLQINRGRIPYHPVSHYLLY